MDSVYMEENSRKSRMKNSPIFVRLGSKFCLNLQNKYQKLPAT